MRNNMTAPITAAMPGLWESPTDQNSRINIARTDCKEEMDSNSCEISGNACVWVDSLEKCSSKVEPWCTQELIDLGYARCENFHYFCNGNQVVPKKVYPKQDTRCVNHPYGKVYSENETWGWCEIEAHCSTNM
jgi:hypothetical protein